MPKKKVVAKEEPVLVSRPQRNMVNAYFFFTFISIVNFYCIVLLQKAKVVFDPSDIHIPKKRKIIPKKSVQSVNISPKKTPGSDKKNNQNVKPKSKLIKELSDSSINEVTSVFSEQPLSNSPIRPTTETCEEVLDICSLCSENILINERKLVDCKICMVKGNMLSYFSRIKYFLNVNSYFIVFSS